MSLATDSIFIEALKADTALMTAIGSRLYGTAIPLPDEDLDNVPAPYVIVTFDGLSNQTGTKDDLYEGTEDMVNIGVEVTGRTLDELHAMTENVRSTILSYMRGNDTTVMEYTFTADAIQFDSMKPCYWQVLHYQCDVYNSQNDEQDEE